MITIKLKVNYLIIIIIIIHFIYKAPFKALKVAVQQSKNNSSTTIKNRQKVFSTASSDNHPLGIGLPKQMCFDLGFEGGY